LYFKRKRITHNNAYNTRISLFKCQVLLRGTDRAVFIYAEGAPSKKMIDNAKSVF
jgi:hypothetical protein